MPKNTHHEKPLQGMEHLLRNHRELDPRMEGDIHVSEHRLLKRELLLAGIIMLVLFGVLVGIAWYDSSMEVITEIASRVTKLFK